MPDIKFATADVSAMKHGTTNVSKVMLGTVEVWPGGVCTDVLAEPFNSLAAWTVAGTPTIVAGRTGTAAQTTAPSSTFRYTIPALNESDTVTLGLAFKVTAIPVSIAASGVIELLSDAGATAHVRIRINTDGSFSVMRASNVLGSTAAGVLVANTWYYFELQARLHDTTGMVVARLNGATLVNVPAGDTKNSGTKIVFDSIKFSGNSNIGNFLVDDLYLSTGAGCSFKGDHTIP